ncbi:Ubiquitin carboxyl-terminal hydrolase 8 [Camellia lanceoleosa]|uniref:Ubiquitin carboxyl-terminal hydrolase 8 n=1 Tax=Camellia lanceoleosa TaxID=1840588 RepID=A0ACC0GHK3_9ERIC|nr:Ubiquitin carboxyl-terminal hydrolase 8 [Camellia lanceoleosa]
MCHSLSLSLSQCALFGQGELALQFGDLLRKLWAPRATPIAPRAFKSKLFAFAPQFSGYSQHDSQVSELSLLLEVNFLLFFLDGLPKDLNRVKYKPYIEAKEAEDRPDEEVVDEHWQNHLARNDSIIVDGQYHSKLVCPAYKKLPITFDPFMYLSSPLPSTTMHSMTLTVMSTDGSTLPFPVIVTLPKYGRCKDLVQAFSTTCSLRDDEKLLATEPTISPLRCFDREDLTAANHLATVVLRSVIRFRSCRSNDVTGRWWSDLTTTKSHHFSLTTTALLPSTWLSSVASASSPPASFKEKATDPLDVEMVLLQHTKCCGGIEASVTSNE